MTPVTTMAGRTVGLFGLGGSGLATADALRAGGADVVVWDDNPDSVARARDKGFRTEDLRQTDWSMFAVLILAPGVPLTHPKPHWTVELAKAAGVEVIGDVELFCRERSAHAPNAPFVAVTGTNGKSTTTALIAHVLREAGRNVQMGGNIGVPILALDTLADDRIHVIECSSYQIDLAPSLAPSVGVLLNITPDHLDRHGTFAAYAAIKERLVAASDVAVIATDDESTREIAARLERAGRTVRRIASTHEDAPLRIGPCGHVSQPERGEVGLICHPDATRAIRGRHNAQNALAAAAVGIELGLSHARIRNGLMSFPGLAHRMEPVATKDGVTFINDSKATNAEAAAPALTSSNVIHWIAGGLPKDGGIEALRPHFGHVARAYLIGEAAPQFAATLGETVPYEIAGTLDIAVRRAAHDAELAGGGVVLFSPAAASFDQYRNFEERGEAFRSAVANVLSEHATTENE